jgi:hypothetical protein
MRYSSAVVLSTLAIGQASAATIHNRHASFHARREASKRGEEVDWKALAYDLKDVDWDKVNWSSVFASTPAAKPTPTAEQKQPSVAAVTPTPEPKKETPAPVAPTSAKPVESKAAEPSAKAESTGNKVTDLVSDVMVGVASIANKLGTKIGKNDKSDNGGIWISDAGAWGMDVTNTGGSDAVFYCWKANGFDGMSINKFVPDISVGLKPGKSVSLSFAPNVPAACAPATDATALGIFGGLKQTWAEVTFGNNGAFDVSRNVNMQGCNISMKGSKCTSDMETCVFKCKDNSAESCTFGYDLMNCGAGSGGGGGYDPIMQGTGGGCAMAADGERIKVSFS